MDFTNQNLIFTILNVFYSAYESETSYIYMKYQK